jgi:uncharacterized repeat protein (TIGR03803 family)
MKRKFPYPFVFGALLIHILAPSRAAGQVETTLYSFSGGADGGNPAAPLVLVSNTLWGTTFGGGSGYGTVFGLKTDGTGFTNLHSFLNYSYNDGADTYAGLASVNGTLFGTAFFGGNSGNAGTLFKVNTDRSGYATLRYFSTPAPPNYVNNDGANSRAGLLLVGDTLYGVATGGGAEASGTVFRMNTNGTAFTNLHNFARLLYNTNNEGARPYGSLILFSNTLFGTTSRGGFWGNGTVFRVNTDGTGFANLYHFSATLPSTNSDGAWPYGGLVLSGGTLFGTTEQGGPGGVGTVFSIHTDGSGFKNLHSFEPIVNPYGTNSDGGMPYGDLILAGDTLYGTARGGGVETGGTVFALNTNGTGFVNLHEFTRDFVDGRNPQAGLILAGCTLYGTTANGGVWGNGTVFSLVLVPGIANFTLSGSDLLVDATNGVANCTYTLLSTTNSALPLAEWTPIATNVPTRAGPFTFTLSNVFDVSQAQQFYTIRAQ